MTSSGKQGTSRLGVLMLAVAIIGVIVKITTPEIRRSLGLPQTSYNDGAPISEPPTTPGPSQAAVASPTTAALTLRVAEDALRVATKAPAPVVARAATVMSTTLTRQASTLTPTALAAANATARLVEPATSPFTAASPRGPVVASPDDSSLPGVSAEVLFADLFDGAPSLDCGECYSQGEYHLGVNNPNCYWASFYAGHTFADVAIDVDMRAVDSPYWEGGILFRNRGEGTGYGFELCSPGGYFLRTWLGDSSELVYIIRPTRHACVLGGSATNHLRAVLSGPTIALYANDCLLDIVQDPAYSDGDVGLMVASMPQPPNVAVAFDNLAIRALSP